MMFYIKRVSLKTINTGNKELIQTNNYILKVFALKTQLRTEIKKIEKDYSKHILSSQLERHKLPVLGL